MSQLLSKKYDLVERNHTQHKNRTIGKAKDVKVIENEINRTLNLIFKDRLMHERKTNAEMKTYIYKKIKPQMSELEYLINSFHIKRYVSNRAYSLKIKIDHLLNNLYK